MSPKKACYSTVMFLLVGGVALGQQPVKRETTVKEETKRNGHTVSKTYQKSSEVLGTPISANEENIGKVEDLVVDVNTGRVIYGVGSFTTVKDGANRLYAIPWPAGHYSVETKTYELPIETERLQSAPSFTRTEWPNLADDEFVTKTYTAYNATPYWKQERTVVKTTDRPVTTTTYTAPTTVTRVTELRGRAIITPEGTRLGQIEEVVMDPASGRILYGVTTRDGQSVPIPWTALRAKGNDFVLTIAADRWKTAPVIETTRWTTLHDPAWTTQVYRYYEVEPDFDHDDDD